jgi:NAD(P)-dependent dehydrogenase (short-subunit alcohol dehydrogenase family)
MRGRVVVITGATSGIGQVAAERLAGMGARVVLVARDRARGEAALERLREHAPGLAHGIHYADLSRLGEMKRVAAEIAAAEPRIDVLINNAGALFSSRQVTEDGLERTFATNHVAYFVLTHRLRERLIASAPARVINTASAAHRGARLDFDDLQSRNDYRGLRVYGRSKLCNILYTRALAHRLAGTGITANCCIRGSSPRGSAIRAAACSPTASASPSSSPRSHSRRGRTRSSTSPPRPKQPASAAAISTSVD